VEARLLTNGLESLSMVALTEVCGFILVRETEEGTAALNRSGMGLLEVDFAGAGVLRACSACFSRARRRLSFVLPDSVYKGVEGTVLVDDGGVLVPFNSAAVLKFGPELPSILPLS
jgi:hypothetical protein